MAIRKPKKKAKKNPYRLSSDRQPGVAKANKGKKKQGSVPGPRYIPIPKGDGPKYARPLGKPTPEQLKKIRKKFKELLKDRKNPSLLGLGSLGLGKAAKSLGKAAAKKVTKKRGGGIAKRGMGKAK